MDCLKKLNYQQCFDRVSKSCTLRTLVIALCQFQVMFLLILLISYISTAMESLDSNPTDNKGIVYMNLMGRVILILFYVIPFIEMKWSCQVMKIVLSVTTVIDFLIFVYRICLLVTDGKRHDTDGKRTAPHDNNWITIVQLFTELVTIGVLIKYIVQLWKKPVVVEPPIELTEESSFLGSNGNNETDLKR